MTVLDHEEISARNKSANKSESLGKRKNSEIDSQPSKKLANEKMINEYNNSSSSHYRFTGDSPVVTLSNMGNTCFLNSVLYTLRFAPTFLHNLHHLIGDLTLINSRLNQNRAQSSSLGCNTKSISGPSSRSTNSKDLLSLGNCHVIPKSKVQIVTEKLHELFITMHNLELQGSGDAYQPLAFLQAVRDANYIFEGNYQQDAHELLVYLLDNIRETCNFLNQLVENQPELLSDSEGSDTSNSSNLWSIRRSGKEVIQNENYTNGFYHTDAEDAVSVDSSSNNSNKKIGYNFVAEDFGGVTLRRTKCLECEGVTERKEPFYDISVPILYNEDYETDPSEIYRKACVTSEKLCDSNKYLCDTCKRYNEASREVLFEKLPNIMVLQLKRFTTTVAGVKKVHKYLPIPLELKCFCESCCQLQNGLSLHRYQLCCVIMHLGRTMASGHYISYVKVTDHFEDYTDCSRDLPLRELSTSIIENQNGISSESDSTIGMCKSIDCCGIKLNKDIVQNVANSNATNNAQEKWQQSSMDVSGDMWLECDDENVRPITNNDFQDLLSHKPNSSCTPYLLFYSKITDSAINE